jgi:hypothetical protein
MERPTDHYNVHKRPTTNSKHSFHGHLEINPKLSSPTIHCEKEKRPHKINNLTFLKATLCTPMMEKPKSHEQLTKAVFSMWYQTTFNSQYSALQVFIVFEIY